MCVYIYTVLYSIYIIYHSIMHNVCMQALISESVALGVVGLIPSCGKTERLKTMATIKKVGRFTPLTKNTPMWVTHGDSGPMSSALVFSTSLLEHPRVHRTFAILIHLTGPGASEGHGSTSMCFFLPHIR